MGAKSSVRCPGKRKAEALRHAEEKASQRGRQRLEFCCRKQRSPWNLLKLEETRKESPLKLQRECGPADAGI